MASVSHGLQAEDGRDPSEGALLHLDGGLPEVVIGMVIAAEVGEIEAVAMPVATEIEVVGTETGTATEEAVAPVTETEVGRADETGIEGIGGVTVIAAAVT